MENLSIIIPDEFVGKMFLTPEDIKEILRMGRSATYNYLNKCEDFAVIRVGTLIRVQANSFWEWYENLGRIAWAVLP